MRSADQDLNTIIALSREYGANPDYVLGGGGNTSVKNNEILHVKASGIPLAGINADGFVAMSRRALNAIWTKTYSRDADAREAAVLADMMNARAAGGSAAGNARRPSVESLLHNLFPFRYVVHIHPTMVNGLTCSADNVRAAREILGEEFIWLPVLDPGYVLAAALREALERSRSRPASTKLMLLQNHGVFAAADSAAEIRSIYGALFSRIAQRIDKEPAQNSHELTDSVSRRLMTRAAAALPGKSLLMFTNSDIDNCIMNEQNFAGLRLSITPDHIVYCGYRPLFVNDPAELEHDIAAFQHNEGFAPVIIAVKGQGIIAAQENDRKAALARQLFEDNVKIVMYARSFGGVQFMPEANINFIRNWEAEKYRAAKTT